MKTQVSSLLVLAVLLAASTFSHAQEAAPVEKKVAALPRTLVLCLDGVGYDLVEEMYRRGELRHFRPPAPLINAFPSLTNPGLVEILAPLGAPPARGYEDYYFDPAGNRMRGGLLYRFSRRHFIGGTYRDLFHYHPNHIRMTLEYALPVVGPLVNGGITLRAIKKRFLQSKERVFFAYYDSSDYASHVHGKWLPRHLLRRIDRLAAELKRDPRHPVEVVVFSDHGNAHRRLRKAKLGKALQRAGFRLAGKLKDRRSVVLPKFGLVSVAVLYTQPGEEMAAAEALRRVQGVDLVVYRHGGALEVLAATGAAFIERRAGPDGSWFRYEAESGDPLQLAAIVDRLRAEGRADADGFVHEGDWLRATAEHVYPDPLRRLWGAFEGLVEQPASVIVSLEDGYYAGSFWLDLVAVMRATHGNLGRAQSRGMVLSTTARVFAPLRGEQPEPLTGRDLLAHVHRLHDYALPIRPWQRSLFTWLPPVARGSIRRPLPGPATPGD
ncbi:MAG: hypothetical protein IH916_06125 [Acidobacteria bacterium]|nr:hypothetical protein [Acidobacteriota bacterium]